MRRFLAGRFNLGVQSVPSLSLAQCETLINQLIEMYAAVKKSNLYAATAARKKIAPFYRGE